MTLELAHRAAGLWPVEVVSLALAAERENAVFKLEALEAGTFALRLHRAGYRSNGELVSELQMMAYLADNGLTVPAPIAGRDGALLQHCDGRQVSLLSWVKGRPLGKTGEPLDIPQRKEFFFRFGQLIARLHDLYDAWVPPAGFTRQSWDREGLLGEAPQWGRFWDNPHLTATEQQLLRTVRSELRARLSSASFDQGLIHADLVAENILVDRDAITLIDFDDSGYGYRLQDLATALVKFEAEPDFPELRDALLEGYRARARVTAAQVALFLFIRHMTYVGWVVPRMNGAEGAARCRRFIASAVEKAERGIP